MFSGPVVALGGGGGGRKTREGGAMGARKGSRHPGCQGTTPVLEASGDSIPWWDAEAASLLGRFEWLPGPSLSLEATPPPLSVLCLCCVFATWAYVAALHWCLVRPVL